MSRKMREQPGAMKLCVVITCSWKNKLPEAEQSGAWKALHVLENLHVKVYHREEQSQVGVQSTCYL